MFILQREVGGASELLPRDEGFEDLALEEEVEAFSFHVYLQKSDTTHQETGKS